jgi:hypothetical protein
MSKQKYTSREELLDHIISCGGITKFLATVQRPPYDLDTGHPSDVYIDLVSQQMLRRWDDYLSYATKFLNALDDSTFSSIAGED